MRRAKREQNRAIREMNTQKEKAEQEGNRAEKYKKYFNITVLMKMME